MSDNTAVSEQINGGSGNKYIFRVRLRFLGTRFENVTIEVDIDKPALQADSILPRLRKQKAVRQPTVAGAIGGIFKLGSRQCVCRRGRRNGHGQRRRAQPRGGRRRLHRRHQRRCNDGQRHPAQLRQRGDRHFGKSQQERYSTAGGIVSIVIQTANSFRLEMDGCRNEAASQAFFPAA